LIKKCLTGLESSSILQNLSERGYCIEKLSIKLEAHS
jgi:hypothetical protein